MAADWERTAVPFDLSDYEPVQARLGRFWVDHPDGCVSTRILYHPADHGSWVVEATVTVVVRTLATGLADVRTLATGLAEEVPGQGNVNRTSALENCETSAVGRALANAGYSPSAGQRASREEMEKVDRSDRARDAALDQLKAMVEQLDPPFYERWLGWKAQRPGWQKSDPRIGEGITHVGVLLAEQGVEPFGDVEPSGSVAAPAGSDDAPASLSVPPPAGDSPPSSDGGTDPAPETATAGGLGVEESEQRQDPPGEELTPDDPGGYLHPNGEYYPWPAGRISARWRSDELAAWLAANGVDEIPDSKTARYTTAVARAEELAAV